uniref:Uncharacterized protein n=1 Tax=Equus asinus asinus TaxID=83772 RepID=A0A8C4KW25_EQUAS
KLKCLSLLLIVCAAREEPYYAGFKFPALICFECDGVNMSGVCQSGESFWNIHEEDDTISYGYQGYSSICIDMTLFNCNNRKDLKYCDNSSLCNKF